MMHRTILHGQSGRVWIRFFQNDRWVIFDHIYRACQMRMMELCFPTSNKVSHGQEGFVRIIPTFSESGPFLHWLHDHHPVTNRQYKLRRHDREDHASICRFEHSRVSLCYPYCHSPKFGYLPTSRLDIPGLHAPLTLLYS